MESKPQKFVPVHLGKEGHLGKEAQRRKAAPFSLPC